MILSLEFPFPNKRTLVLHILKVASRINSNKRDNSWWNLREILFICWRELTRVVQNNGRMNYRVKFLLKIQRNGLKTHLTLIQEKNVRICMLFYCS